MWSRRTRGWIIRGLCGLVLVLSGACATGPGDETTSRRTRLAYVSSTGPQPIVATRAEVFDRRFLHVSYLDDDGRMITVGVPLFVGDAGDPRSPDTAPPVARFEVIEPGHPEWKASGASVTVRPAEEWRDLVQRLEHEVAGQVRGRGMVLDVLQQQEVFLYLDDSGKLHAVPLKDKPAAIEPAGTVTLTHLLKRASDSVRQALQQDSGGGRYLLFNTDDTPETGFPFVLIDLDERQVFFIQRGSDGRRLLAHGPAGSAQAAFHAINSQARSLTSRPLSSFARLLASLSTTLWDTLHPTPTWLDPQSPPPPLRHAALMDSDAWESELDTLVGTGSYGRIDYLVDGREFFPALIHALNAARESVRMRMYIFDNDDYAVKMADILKRRSQDVSIQILLDGFGTISGGMAKPDYTPDHLPPGPLSIAAYLRADSNISVNMLSNPWMQGDHTKTIVIDDRTAFLGGMNIGREYRYEWHDLMVAVEGPAVDILIRDFENTRAQAGFLGDLQAAIHRSSHPIREPAEDDYPLRLMYTRTGSSQILRSQIAAMRRAENRVWIQNAYLTSDMILYELVKARRRGVDVRVIMPFRTDSGLISRSNALAANAMLRHGIRVYIYPGMSHLKAAVYDGWACMGSANFDRLSLRLNKETNIATSHPAAVEALVDRVFVADFQRAVELTGPLPAGWLDYLKEQIADHL